MKHTAAKLFQRLLGMALVLTIAVSTTAIWANAASAGIYTATATAHYRNPNTGEIEDSGGESSEVLGQSMTESALYGKALVEIDNSGTTWITVRIQLADNINNISFNHSATLMQEDYGSNTADYRMKASLGSVIRCSMYVVPMGREVIWYITVSTSLSSGSGDFVVTLTDADISSGSNTAGTAAEGGSAGTASNGTAAPDAPAAADMTALNEAITANAQLAQADYTAASWEGFRSALEAAQQTAANAAATQEEADAALSALNTAAEALVKLADKTALNSAIQQVADLKEEDYTAASWKALTEALAAAQAAADKEDAAQEEVDAALSPLYDAMGNLVELADKTELASAIEAAKALTEKDYTTDSWTAVAEALTAAETANEQEDASQKDVDAAAQALNDAVGALVEKSVSPVVIVAVVVVVAVAAGCAAVAAGKKKKKAGKKDEAGA